MLPTKSPVASCAYLFAVLLVAAGPGKAQSPAVYEQSLRTSAQAADPNFGDFSPERGRQLFETKHGREWSCSSCHTKDPRRSGQHAKTGQDIAPMAPVANSKRFTSPAKSEKWFRRNCRDVLARTCTDTEKGDVLSYLISLR